MIIATPTWKVRSLAPGDEIRILKLFEIVFHGQETLEHWRWLFLMNPFSRPIVYLAETGDGRLVGHYSLIPIPFRRNGKRGLAALSIQSMIHPDFQRQGILKALAAQAESQLDTDAIQMGITFLNDNSLHAYLKHFGWTELPDSSAIYFSVLDPRGPINKILKQDFIARLLSPVVNLIIYLLSPGRRVSSSDAKVRQVDNFDSRVDELWRKFSDGIPNVVERDSRYLNWRLADKPDKYSLFVAESTDLTAQLLGIAVAKVDRKFGLQFGYIVELFHDPDRPDLAELLTSHALRQLKDAGCSMATALTIGPKSLQRALRRCGFWKLPRAAMPHGIHFCFKDRALEKEPQEKFASKNWFISWSDHDVV